MRVEFKNFSNGLEIPSKICIVPALESFLDQRLMTRTLLRALLTNCPGAVSVVRRRHLRWLCRKVQESYQSKKTDAGTLIKTICLRISAIIRLFDKGTPRAAFICRCTFLFRPAYIRARLKFLYNRWPIVDPQHCALSATSAHTAERTWSAPHGPAQRTQNMRSCADGFTWNRRSRLAVRSLPRDS